MPQKVQNGTGFPEERKRGLLETGTALANVPLNRTRLSWEIRHETRQQYPESESIGHHR